MLLPSGWRRWERGFLYGPRIRFSAPSHAIIPGMEMHMAQKRKRMLKWEAFAPDLSCQGALQLSCRDLHQLNIYTIWILYYRVDMSFSVSLNSLTRDDLKNQTAFCVTRWLERLKWNYRTLLRNAEQYFCFFCFLFRVSHIEHAGINPCEVLKPHNWFIIIFDLIGKWAPWNTTSKLKIALL